MTAYSFTKSMRLLKRREFQRVGVSSKKTIGKYLILEVENNSHGCSRLGITVTKRYGKAHDRNRFKRIVREGFRLTYPQLPQGLDLVAKPRSHAYGASSLMISNELIQLLTSLK